MGEVDINTLTMEQYFALTRGNQVPSTVKLEIRGNVNFEIKSQFMRQLREDTFLRNKNDDAHKHVERILDIRWVERLAPGTINTWDLLKKAFIQRYCPQSKTAKQLEKIHNVKKESDETLYQAWEKYNDLLYKFPTYDLNIYHKQSKLWLATYRNGMTGQIVGRCKDVKEVKYGKFRRSFPNNSMNSARYHVGLPGYYTRVDNRLPFGERKLNLEEVMNKHLKESIRRRAHMEYWMKKLQESTNMNIRNQKASLKNLETQVEQLTKDYQANATNEVPNSSIGRTIRSLAMPTTSERIKSRKFHSSLHYCMLVEMADMSKNASMGTVENVLVKIDKFVFPTDFVIIDRLSSFYFGLFLLQSLFFVFLVCNGLVPSCFCKLDLDPSSYDFEFLRSLILHHLLVLNHLDLTS
nr:hypothetical protein [Tanacetum cinerariifolium]